MMRMRQRSHTCKFWFCFFGVFVFFVFSSPDHNRLIVGKLHVFFMSFFSSSNNSCLEHLLDNGADPSMVNSKGYSAVHYAAYHGNKQNLELVSFLF